VPGRAGRLEARAALEVHEERPVAPVGIGDLAREDRDALAVGAGVVERDGELVLDEDQAGRRDRDRQNSWFSPPKTSDTLSSVKIRRIESVRSSAQLSTRMLSGAPGRSGIVSVTTICSKLDAARFS
jgi:hypothetical protein